MATARTSVRKAFDTQAGLKDHINTENFDEESAAYKAFIGWRFKLLPVFHAAIEGAYTDFGNPERKNSLGQSTEINVKGPSIAGLAILPLGLFDLYGKLGAIYADVEKTVGTTVSSSSGSSSFYGFGAGLNLGAFALRAEYERFEIKDVDRIDLFSLSALIQF